MIYSCQTSPNIDYYCVNIKMNQSSAFSWSTLSEQIKCSAKTEMLQTGITFTAT